MADTARIDKWLWAARIFKTRSIASDACKNGRVTIGGVDMKPSRTIKVGDVINVKKPPITYSFKVLKTIWEIWTLKLRVLKMVSRLYKWISKLRA